MADPTLEQLYENLEKIGKVANKMETFMATHDNDKDKEAAAKKAEDEKKEEEKMEAKKAKYSSAIKRAMEEDDHDKMDAAIRKAQEEYTDKKHEAFGKPDEHDANEMEEKKEHEAQIASIINEKKNSLIKQILTANRIINPNGIAQVEARLKTASITEIEKEFNIVKPFIAGIETTVTPTPQDKFIPFFANITPADIDANQLSASSPDSEFNKLTTAELLEMNR